jgi:branched-chain amino acid aminotransferase
MPTLAIIDGTLKAAEEASVSIFDRGFLYGDSVFETLRTYDREPYELQAHLERLAWSAGRVHIAPPVTRDVLASEVRQAIAATGEPECYVRVMITRGRAESLGLDPALAGTPLRVVVAGPLQTPSPEAYEQGVSVACFRTQRLADATDAAGAKVGNYLVAVLAMHEAHRVGAAEALVIDAHGHVIEGANSNLFAVIVGRLVTPPLDTGILPGITRARVIELARELGVPVDLRPLKVDELRTADEVFLSSTIRELLPVVRVEDAIIADGRPGAVTRRLLARFREHVHQWLAQRGA